MIPKLVLVFCIDLSAFSSVPVRARMVAIVSGYCYSNYFHLSYFTIELNNYSKKSFNTTAEKVFICSNLIASFFSALSSTPLLSAASRVKYAGN
jgi:hypothetical protein